ncbi:synaptotagmin-2-like isoform X2 [Eleutherodactylus coqui]|uniref:synaptotagmin-2-like isoform X2 n=1 Tax=Eleutherodactylus coqui TaxID=57060 RepID=UPI0034623EB8
MCSAFGGNGNMRFLSFQIHLPFSDTLKYSLLALSIALFLAALIILACKMHQYFSYKATSAVKDKKFVSGSNAEKKMEKNILIKSLSPNFLDVARKEQDSKIQLMQKEMEKLEVHLTPSPPSTESLDNVGSDSDYPQGARGRLKFHLHYNEKTTTLRLAVIEATDLPEYTRDPFVKDFDKYSRHTLIGETRTVLKDLKVSESFEFNEELQEKSKDIIGEVLVSLKCLPTAQKIEVGILKFKTSSPNIKERDVYARIDVFTNHHKQKHQKSSLRAKSKVTVFNETFLFSLPDLGKSQCLILISLYETLSSGKKLIGQTTVGNQKTKFKDNHWDLMMQTLRQPVAAWHLLHI